MELLKLRAHPEYLEPAAAWFGSKWGIPEKAYRDSISETLANQTGVPQWYLLLDGEGRIAGGAGVIENDFHDRPDLTPNLCALFVEPEHRNRGLARDLLNAIRRDLADMGFDTLYLVTDHTEFYEKCGWDFLTLVNDTEGVPERMYAARTASQG